MIAGLTGGIGSGKSTVAGLFVVLGWLHYNSDTVAKSLYFHPEIKKKIIRLLGEEAYLKDGTPNKPYIGTIVFGKAEILQQLNAILHPAVADHFKTFCKEHPHQNILKESALLFEAGLNQQMDKVILVTAPDEIRIQRVMKRDGLSRELVVARMKNQIPQEEKIKKADFVITNDEKTSLIEQVVKVHKVLF